MDKSTDKIKDLSGLIDEHRPRETLMLFLKEVGGKSFSTLSPSEAVCLDLVCQRVLPQLLEDHTLWLVNHPDRLRRMLELLTGALAVNYRPAATVDQIAWLRCLLAIGQAIAGQIEHVHEELCLVGDCAEADALPEPNGRFREQVQCIELTERTNVEFLKQFFASYMEFLRRVGQHELANSLDNRIGTLLGHIARDEERPGVAQALFYDKTSGQGHLGFIHVSIERDSRDGQSEKAVEYARHKQDVIDTAMLEAARYAREVVDAYLKRAGYPDGLDERLVRWEIATLEGDPVELGQQFRGGSVALPLAVAIISEYLAKPVPNDVALTGAFTETSMSDGHILPVDGIPQKVEHAAASGCRLIYVPNPNLTELSSRPAVQNLIGEHGGRVVAAETLDQVCEELFPPEGSGRLRDVMRDTVANVVQIMYPAVRSGLTKPIHERYRLHVIGCGILTAALVFLEGWKLYKAFAPDYPAMVAWTRILVSTAVVFLGMVVSFALPAACLLHRKSWSWYAGIAVTKIGICAAIVLIGQMLPDFARISTIHNAPPAAGLVKDMFIMWIFAWAIAANTLNAVAALQDLVARRQFVTARTCLRWDSPLEARMPIRCIHFPWSWGVVFIGAVVAFLMVLELNYYATIDTSTSAGYWETFLGLGRDLLFIAAIGEVVVFYKQAIARIRRALG